MEQSEFRTRCLCQKLDHFHKIVIYGTGDYSGRIYPFLVEYGLKGKICCFTQTMEGKQQSIDGIPVIKFDKLIDYDKEECAVLIAVSEVYLDEIKQKLSQCHCLNVFALTDYRKHTEASFEHHVSYEEYCDIISDWYVETRIGNLDKETVFENLLERGESAAKRIDARLIVMICGHLTPRSIKIAGALKRARYSVVMLRYNINQDKTSNCMGELEKLGIPRIDCPTIENMLYAALQYKPLVYFFEPRWADCSWANIMLKNRQYFGKIVLALYDVLNDGLIDQPRKHLESEKYALEHADGIVWRWFSKDYLETKGFRFQGKSIQFLDYCNSMKDEGSLFAPASSVLKLCEVSGVADAHVEDRSYSDRFLDCARVGEILEKVGNRSDCVFHFYAAHMREENYEKCCLYEKMYKNFKFFVGVEHDELLDRLREYDYGCDFYTDGEWPPDDILVGKFAGSSRKNAVRNILFDYLSAGLPIITTVPQKLLEYLQPYNIVVKMNIDNLDWEYLRQNRNIYKQNAHLARTQLSIDDQIRELIDFFTCLS